MASVVTCLGFVSEIRYTEKGTGNEYVLEFKSKNSWNTQTGKDSFLMVTAAKHEIAIIPWSKVKRVEVPKGAKSRKAFYEDWAGYEQTEAFRLTVPKSKPALIGHITRIEYTSDKFERKGDKAGKFHLYRHVFRKKQKLYSNRVHTVLAIVGPRSKSLLNYRGIVA